MKDSHEPIPIPSKIEYRIAVYIIGIWKRLTNINEIAPSTVAYDGGPCPYLFFGIRVVLGCVSQMPQRYDAHLAYVTSQFVKCQR
jgi:hypothetical protein